MTDTAVDTPTPVTAPETPRASSLPRAHFLELEVLRERNEKLTLELNALRLATDLEVRKAQEAVDKLRARASTAQEELKQGKAAFEAYATKILPELGIADLSDFSYTPEGKILTTEELAEARAAQAKAQAQVAQ